MQLTAKQIEAIDQISAEKQAVKRTLNVALQFASNRAEELLKDEKHWWEEMAEIHGFDVYDKDWTVDRVNGMATIIEKD